MVELKLVSVTSTFVANTLMKLNMIRCISIRMANILNQPITLQKNVCLGQIMPVICINKMISHLTKIVISSRSPEKLDLLQNRTLQNLTKAAAEDISQF